jgi:hypothetical protein
LHKTTTCHFIFICQKKNFQNSFISVFYTKLSNFFKL